MTITDNPLDLIGHTPVVPLRRLVEPGMATVLVKLEYLNPTGSNKDRIAKFMIEQAEKDGRLKPGGTIVESSAGNTGLGLALVAAIKGYRCIITIPDKMSLEKINMLKAYGAEVVVTPTAVSYHSPEHYVQVAKRIVRETPNAFYVDQYYSPANTEAHYRSTGPELWEQTEGKIDYFVLSAGTGGSLSGVGRYIKEQANKEGREIKVIVPDPLGSVYFDYFYAKPEKQSHTYKVEGIGNDVLVGNLDLSIVDEMRKVSDRQSFLTARRLAKEEGLFCGGSSGANVFTALQVAREVGPDKVVVTFLTDSGNRYVSKFFNDEWMRDLGYLDLDTRYGVVRDLLKFKGFGVEFVEPDEKLQHVAERMSKLGISQMPLRVEPGEPLRIIDEIDLLTALVSGVCRPDDPVLRAAYPLEGMLAIGDPISKLEQVFAGNKVAFVVDEQRIVGVVTKIDLVRYLVNRG